MSSSNSLVYRIDRDDRIVAVNDAWTVFAGANAGDGLLPPSVLGTSLFAAISDASTREIYRLLLRRARNDGAPLRFRFRCDAPHVRRLLEMTVSGFADNVVEFSTLLIASETRSALSLIDPAQARSDTLLRICAWCTRVAMPDERWIEVHQALAELRLLEQSILPRITHGMCPACFTEMERALETENGKWPLNVSVGEFAAPK